jgi:N-acyl-D-amino-acid deacylase
MFDLLFRKARIVDGTGNPWFWGDVGVEGDRITAVGDLSGASAQRTIDLDGAMLAPGFIDLHSHSDFATALFPRAESMVRQGITTQFTGNCGLSPFPVERERLDLLRNYTAFLGSDSLSFEWQNVGGFARYLESLPLSFNIGFQVGHGSVRIAAMGFEQRDPTPAELDTMQKLTAQAMEEGAFGVSSGLIYAPGSYSKTEELVALAQVVGRYGGFYSSHIRGEGATLLNAVEEAIMIGREAGVPVQLSHHKASGKANWGLVKHSLQMIDEARARGQDVLADQYPYTAGQTTLTALLPVWALEGGVEAMRARLADPETHARIYKAMANADPDSGTSQFGVETVTIIGLMEETNLPYEGLALTEIAARRNEDPIETVFYLLTSELKGPSIIVHTMSEDDVKQVMRHPAIAVGTDGSNVSPDAPIKVHPRFYGTFPRVLGKYVREEQVLRLEEAIRKMTSLPAQRLGRYDLGLIRPGCQADLVIFEAERIKDEATYQTPHHYAQGIDYVVVNGQVVIEAGQDTGAKAGRVLLRKI